MAAFKSLIKTNFSTEVLRSLSLFITFCFHKSSASRPLRMKKSTVHLQRQNNSSSPTNLSNGSFSKANQSSKREIGVSLLEIYSEVLCEATNTVNITKFARTITNKVINIQ